MNDQFTTPMMKQYMEIKSRYPDCLLFFRLGDFYEMFLEDAKIAAKVLNITLTSRSRGKDGRIPMAGVPFHAVDSYLAKLVKAGYKVAICEQLEDPLLAKGLVERGVIRVVTPGTVLDEKALEKKENNYIASVVLNELGLGISLADISTGDLLVSEYTESNFESILINELVKFNVSECIVSPILYSKPSFLKLIKRIEGINVYAFKDWRAYTIDPSTYLKDFFNVKGLLGYGISDKPFATESCAALIGYLNYTQNNNLNHIKTIKYFNLNNFLSLDRSSILNLEIFSTIRERDKRGTLIFQLDETISSMGGRLLRQWLSKPLIRKKEISLRHEAVEELIKKRIKRDELRTLLVQVADIERILSKISVGVSNTADFHGLKESLKVIIKIKNTFKNLNSKLFKNVYKDISNDLSNIVKEIERTLIEDCPIDPKEGGIIKDGVDKELDKVRKSIQDSKDYVLGLQDVERKRSGISSLKVKFNKVFGYYIEISRANANSVPKNYFRKQTLVNAERFITEDLKKHEEIILKAEEVTKVLEYKAYKDLAKFILQFSVKLQQAALSIATLDCISNFSYISETRYYIKPTLTENGDIIIKDGRHPMVENLLEGVSFVPNDTYLTNKNTQLMLITGPNMAGKSVYLRQVALICLMSQIGCFVPASKATLTILDKIFVRSGASDVITSGLSTFMVEMVETANILNNATSNSLIAMDEVGRGTSTYDGISIAQAISEYLVSKSNITPKTLFATHYHELQSLEKKFPNKVKNFQMGVDDKSGIPVFLYKVLDGGASHSYGIAVASLAGVPISVTQRAFEILKNIEGKKDMGNGHKEISNDSILKNILLTVDLNKMTPVEALNFLDKLKKEVK